MTTELTDRTFEYLLNAMEHAAQREHPAEHNYKGKREAVFAYVADLQRRAAPQAPDPAAPPVALVEAQIPRIQEAARATRDYTAAFWLETVLREWVPRLLASTPTKLGSGPSHEGAVGSDATRNQAGAASTDADFKARRQGEFAEYPAALSQPAAEPPASPAALTDAQIAAGVRYCKFVRTDSVAAARFVNGFWKAIHDAASPPAAGRDET